MGKTCNQRSCKDDLYGPNCAKVSCNFLEITLLGNFHDVSISCKLNFIRRFANVRTAIRSYVIPGPDNVPAKWDGTAKLVPGHVLSTRLARTVKIVATARTTRSVRPSMALVSARPAIAERIVVSCVP